jgi:predicted Zn-ribbon and HTH transcriptional regulator
LLCASISSFIIYIVRATYLTKISGDILGCIISFFFFISFITTLYKIYNRRPQHYYNIGLITSATYSITHQQEQSEITGKLPDYVAKQLVEKAITENKTCPISLEPIISRNSGVLNCGHVFRGTSLQAHLQTDNKCPVCRKQPIVPTYYIIEDNPV